MHGIPRHIRAEPSTLRLIDVAFVADQSRYRPLGQIVIGRLVEANRPQQAGYDNLGLRFGPELHAPDNAVCIARVVARTTSTRIFLDEVNRLSVIRPRWAAQWASEQVARQEEWTGSNPELRDRFVGHDAGWLRRCARHHCAQRQRHDRRSQLCRSHSMEMLQTVGREPQLPARRSVAASS